MEIKLNQNGYPEKQEAMYAYAFAAHCDGLTQPEVGKAFMDYFAANGLKPSAGTATEYEAPNDILYRGLWTRYVEGDPKFGEPDKYEGDIYLVFCVPA